MPVVTVIGKNVKNPYEPTDPYNNDYAVPYTSTATRTNIPVFETPFSIETVSQQVIKDQQMVHLTDAVKNVSGVQPAFTFGEGADGFYMRGFLLGDPAVGTIIYRDGFRGVGFSMDAGNIERIDVLKGAAASLYGRIEPGGIINVITKKPLANPYYSLEQQFGSYDLYRTIADATGPLNEDGSLRYRTIVTYRSNNSFRDFVSSDHLTITPSLAWDITPQTHMLLSFQYQDLDDVNDFGVPAVGNRPASIPISRFLSVIDKPKNHQNTYLVDLNLTQEFNEDWKLRSRFQWWHVDGQLQSGGGTNLQADNRTLDIYNTANYQLTTDSYFATVDLQGQFDTWRFKHKTLAGWEFYNDQYPQSWHQANSDNPDTPFILPMDIYNPSYQRFGKVNALTLAQPLQYYHPTNEWNAVFFQDQIAITDRLKILGGGRQDWASATSAFCLSSDPTTPNCPQNPGPINSRFDSVFKPRVGISFQATDWLMLYGSYSESYGAQSLQPLLNGGLTKAQTAEQGEIGVKGLWLDGKMTSTLALYDLTKTNLNVPVPGQPNVVQQIGEGNSRGVEFDFTGRVTDEWSVIANYAYTDAKITKDAGVDENGNPTNGNEGKRLPNIPKHSGGIWNQYDFSNGFGMGAGVYAASDRQGDPGNTFQLPGFVRLDTGLSYKLKVGPSTITARFNINNLLDHTYYASTQENRANITPATPRTFLGSLRLEF